MIDIRVTANKPVSGPIGGGTDVTITVEGTDLDEATLRKSSVKFGEKAVTVQLETWRDNPKVGTIIATSPPAPAGLVDITLITPGRNAFTKNGAFTYTDEIVKVIGPKFGPSIGGTPVDIEVGGKVLDANKLRSSTVNFGTAAATPVYVKHWDEANHSGIITAISPPGTAGPVDITVITGRVDFGMEEKAFTYRNGQQPAPADTNVAAGSNTVAANAPRKSGDMIKEPAQPKTRKTANRQRGPQN